VSSLWVGCLFSLSALHSLLLLGGLLFSAGHGDGFNCFTVRLIVRCLVAYAGGLDVSSFGFIVVRCLVLPVMFFMCF